MSRSLAVAITQFKLFACLFLFLAPLCSPLFLAITRKAGRPWSGALFGTDGDDLETSMANARKNSAKGTSPGAGLDAFEAADAAYADLIKRIEATK